MKRAKKPRQKTYTLTEKQVEMIKRSVAKDATKKAMLVVMCAVVDYLNVDGKELEDVVKAVDRYGNYLNKDKVLKMRDFAENIYKRTGVDFRSW